MPKNLVYENYLMTSSGGTKLFRVSENTDIYELLATGGAIILSANMAFAENGSPVKGTSFKFFYGGGVTTGIYSVTFMGTALSTQQARYEQIVTAYYDGSAWRVHVCEDSETGTKDINGADIVTGTISADALGSGSVTPIKMLNGSQGQIFTAGTNGAWQTLQAKTSGYTLIGDGTDILSKPISGDVTLASSGAVTIAANAITTGKILAANVTLAKLEAILLVDNIVVQHSFEANEVGAFKIKMNYACSITDVHVSVSKVCAGADVGLLTLQNNAGTTMTVTTPISVPASSVVGYTISSGVTANNTFTAGQELTLTTSKTTAGGRITITLSSTRA